MFHKVNQQLNFEMRKTKTWILASEESQVSGPWRSAVLEAVVVASAPISWIGGSTMDQKIDDVGIMANGGVNLSSLERR